MTRPIPTRTALDGGSARHPVISKSPLSAAGKKSSQMEGMEQARIDAGPVVNRHGVFHSAREDGISSVDCNRAWAPSSRVLQGSRDTVAWGTENLRGCQSRNQGAGKAGRKRCPEPTSRSLAALTPLLPLSRTKSLRLH